MKFLSDFNNLILFAAALVSGGLLLWPYLQTRGRKVSLLQATQMLNQGKPLILDVREPSEFAAGHLGDAVNIPLQELPKRIGELAKHKSKKVIVVCNVGAQSSRALPQLNKAGFTEAYSLEGGITAWQSQGLPVVK